MQEIESRGPSIAEARAAALAALGLSEEQAEDLAEVEVVQEPRSGFLGIAAQEAVVRVRRKTVAPRDRDRGDDGTELDVDEQADIAADFLEDLLDLAGLEAEVDIAEDLGTTYVEIWGAEGDDRMGLLIGRHGAVLDAVQELVRAVVQRQSGQPCRVMVDVEDYRKRRRARIVQQARQVAARVRRSGRAEALEPMNAFERKIVHDAVAEMGGLETVSEGEEPSRRVLIRPAGGGDPA